MNIDVYLANMPVALINYPSLSLGLLKAILKRDGFKSKIFYGNLVFAEEAGIFYCNLIFSHREQLLGSWLFSPLVFPDYRDDTDKYIEMFFKELNFTMSQKELGKELLNFRIKAKNFIYSTAEKILKEKPKIIGVSSNEIQYMASLALLGTIHHMAPEVITLMGGIVCKDRVGLTTHKTFPWIDYLVPGEADNIISPLVSSILEKGRYVSKEELVPGVYAPFCREEGYPEGDIATIKESFHDNPPPDYDDYFETMNSLSDIKYLANPFIPFESSRDCWWGEKHLCNFCGFNSKKRRYRRKDAGEIIKEFEFLSERYGIKRFTAADNIMDMTYFKTLLPELIKRNSPYSIFYEVKTNLTGSQVKMLRDGGVKDILAGIESLDSRILKLMNKGVKAWQNIQLLKWCLLYGIYTRWNIMYGFPGEEDCWYEEMAKIVPLLVHFQPPKAINALDFPRNSHYYINASEYGLNMTVSPFYTHIIPLPEDIIRNLIWYFREKKGWEQRNDEKLHKGLNLLKKECFIWEKLFYSDKRPILKMNHTGDGLEIEDTRPCAVQSSFILKDLHKEIYLNCDEGVMKKKVIKNFTEKGLNETDIYSSIKELIEWKLMIEIDDYLLSLAIIDPYNFIILF